MCPLRSVTFSITPPPHTPSARPWAPLTAAKGYWRLSTHISSNPRPSRSGLGQGAGRMRLWVLVSCALTPVLGVQLGGTHLSPSHCILHQPSHRDSWGPTGWLPHSGQCLSETAMTLRTVPGQGRSCLGGSNLVPRVAGHCPRSWRRRSDCRAQPGCTHILWHAHLPACDSLVSPSALTWQPGVLVPRHGETPALVSVH